MTWQVPTHLAMDGYGARKGHAVSTNDPLSVRAVVIEDGNERVALVNVDVIGVERELIREFRSSLGSALGIEPNQVMVTATHTHSGPSGIRIGPQPLADDLRRCLLDTMLYATQSACNDLQDCRVSFGVGHVSGLSQNRRHPAGPAPSDVPTLLIETMSGKTITVITSFACHPTVLTHHNLQYSADYPGAVAKTVARAAGEDASPPVLFLTGACADINPVRDETGFSEVERFGLTLGGEVLKTVGRLKSAYREPTVDNLLWGETLPVTQAFGRPVEVKLSGLARDVSFELKSFRSADEYRQQLRAFEGQLERPSDEDRRRAITAQLLACRVEASSAATAKKYVERTQEIVHAEIQLWVIGDGVGILGVPGELFSSIGAELAKQWQGDLIVAAYANDYVGYLNTDAAYDEGGYEAGRTLLARGSEARLRGAAEALFDSYQAEVGTS